MNVAPNNLVLLSRSPGLPPEYVAANNLPWLLGVSLTFHLLAWTFCILRVYTRKIIIKAFGKDDVFMISGMIFLCGGGMSTLITAGAQFGWGRHIDTLTKAQQNGYTMMMVFHGIFSSITAFLFIKLSIIFSMMRLDSSRGWYTRALWGLTVLIGAYTIVGWISWAISCYPLNGYWDKSVEALCIPRETFSVFSYVNTVCNITTDFTLATLPIPLVWRLNMPARTRISLVGIFALGYATCVLGVLKIVFQFGPEHQGPDRTFVDWVRLWGFLEGNMGVVVACAPTVHKLLGQCLGVDGGLTSVRQRGRAYMVRVDRMRQSSNPQTGGVKQSRFGAASGESQSATYTESLHDIELRPSLVEDYDGLARREASSFVSDIREDEVVRSKSRSGSEETILA